MQIWNNRNQAVHGKTVVEAQLKAREAVLQQVKDIYANPPRIAPQFPTNTSSFT
jgi:hypothetical protein